MTNRTNGYQSDGQSDLRWSRIAGSTSLLPSVSWQITSHFSTRFRTRTDRYNLLIGRYACPGRQLALTEMSMLMALLVSKYHIRFPSGDDGSRVERDMKDQFTALPGQLDLIFEPRQPETEA